MFVVASVGTQEERENCRLLGALETTLPVSRQLLHVSMTATKSVAGGRSALSTSLPRASGLSPARQRRSSRNSQSKRGVKRHRVSDFFRRAPLSSFPHPHCMSYSPLLHDPDPDDDRETPYPPAPTPVSRLGRSFRDLGARFLEPLDDYVNRVSGRRKRPLWLGDGGGDGSGSRVGGRSLSFAVTGAVLLLLVLAGWSASLREAEERRQSVLDAMEVFRPYEMPKGRKVELVDRYAGEGFLDAFEFFQEPDPTHGT